MLLTMYTCKYTGQVVDELLMVTYSIEDEHYLAESDGLWLLFEITESLITAFFPEKQYDNV